MKRWMGPGSAIGFAETALARWRHHARNGAWGTVEYLVYPLLMFASTPLFLWALGAEQYGQWMLLLTLNSTAQLGGLGMGSAVTKELSHFRGHNDWESMVGSARVGLTITLLTGLSFAIVILAAGALFSDTLFFRMGTDDRILMIFGAGALLTLIEQLDSVFAGIIRGMERYDIGAKIEVTAKLGSIAVMALVAWLTRDLEPVLLTLILTNMIRTIVKAWFASSLLKLRFFLMPGWDPALARTVFRFGKWVWVSSIGTVLFAAGDRLVVGSLLGATALAHYSVALQLAQQISTIPAAGANFVFPAASKRLAEGGDVSAMAWKTFAGILVIAAALTLPLIIFAEPMLTLWVGGNMAAETAAPLVWLSIGYFLMSLNVGPYIILLAMGRSGLVAAAAIVGGVLSLGCALFLIPLNGIDGAAQARIAYSLTNIIDLVAMRRLLSRNRQSRDAMKI